MRPWGVWVGAILRCDPDCTPVGDHLEEFGYAWYLLDGQSYDVDVLFSVLARLQLLPVVQQVEQLAAVDLEEGNWDCELWISGVPDTEYIFGSEVVHAGASILQVSIHGIGFAAPSLSVSKACHLGSEEGALHYRLDALVVKLLVVDFLSEGRVELEHMLLGVFGEVYFEPTDKLAITCAI